MLTAAHNKEPGDARANHFLRNTYADRAKALDLLRRFAEAVKDWDMVINLSSKSEQADPRASAPLPSLSPVW